MKDWRRIWESRRPDATAESPLQGLINLDGFDLGAGRIAEPAWRSYVADICQRLELQRGDSLFEIGCGSGAFLYPIYEQGVRVGGLDYSARLISCARIAMPEGHFTVASADSMASTSCHDYVLANSVFHYFPDLDYAETVVRRMIAAAKRAVAILEVPDMASRDAAEAARRGFLGPQEYEARYAGLEHCYYPRQWFLDIAAKHGLFARTFGQNIPGYAQNPFRFNCILSYSEELRQAV